MENEMENKLTTSAPSTTSTAPTPWVKPDKGDWTIQEILEHPAEIEAWIDEQKWCGHRVPIDCFDGKKRTHCFRKKNSPFLVIQDAAVVRVINTTCTKQ
jgi:hypothetical protein